MNTKIFLATIIFGLFGFSISAQSLNPISHIWNPGTADTFNAGYTFAYATSGTPWNGALISYGGFPTNNYDTQISADYGPAGGKHISFRTKNGDANIWNPWYEILHTGNISTLKEALGQPINGYTLNDITGNGNFSNKSISFGDIDKLGVNWAYNSDLVSLYYSNSGNGSGKLMLDIGDDNLSTQGFNIRGVRYDGVINDVAYFNAQGNVGIGTTTPAAKLDVNGNIAVGGLSAGSDASPLSKKIVAYNYQSIEAGAIDFLDFNSSRHATSIAFRAKNSSNVPEEFMRIVGQDGKVGIGTTIPDEKLTVNGTIHSTEVKVTQSVPADYVFQKYYTGKSELKPDYTLLTLSEVEKFTAENHHLPDVPSAKEIKENGLQLGEMSNALLQKIEELTLYVIEQNKKIEIQQIEISKQSKEIIFLKEANASYKTIEERMSKLENQLKK